MCPWGITLYSFLKLAYLFSLQTSELKQLPAILWSLCTIAMSSWVEPPNSNTALQQTSPLSAQTGWRDRPRESETCPVSSMATPRLENQVSPACLPAHSSITWLDCSSTSPSQHHPSLKGLKAIFSYFNIWVLILL